jgi:rod shape-determining protein MreD
LQQRILFYTLSVIVLALVQKFLLDKLALYDVAPDAVLVLLVFIAQREGQSAGTTTGFFIGLVMDLLHGTLGVDAFSKTIAGFTAGFFSESDGAGRLGAFIAAVAVASVAGLAAYYLVAYGFAIAWWKFLLYAAVGSAYNVVFGYAAHSAILRRL